MRVSHSKRMRVGSSAQALLLGEEEQPRAEVPPSVRVGEIKYVSNQPLVCFLYIKKAEFSSAQVHRLMVRDEVLLT